MAGGEGGSHPSQVAWDESAGRGWRGLPRFGLGWVGTAVDEGGEPIEDAAEAELPGVFGAAAPWAVPAAVPTKVS